MHKLLDRQLRRHFGSLAAVPAELNGILADVDRTYAEADADRRFTEHSLELTSQELMQRNADLRSKQREQQVIFDSVPALIIYKDTRNRILRLNEVAAKVLGGTAAEIEGKLTDEVLPKQVAEALYDDDLKVISTGKPRLGVEESHPTADGQVHWMRTDKVPFFDDGGNVVGIIVFSVDITARREAEEHLKSSEDHLKQAYAQLQKVDRERMQFLNNAAHELGTPLTPIRLQVHLLRNRLRAAGRDAAEMRAIDIIDRNFERLGHLVRDLLDSARLQAVSMKLHRMPIDLRDVVYSSVETYLAPANEAGVELQVGDLPAMPVECDTSRISQVLDNLLSNAVKFTPQGQAIKVDGQVVGGMARVTVRDAGAGIRPEDLSKLFRPFSQVHDTMQSTKGGTGLGLYISQGLVQAHGGQIRAESAGLGRGATFWFELPLRTLQASPRHAVAAAGRAEASVAA